MIVEMLNRWGAAWSDFMFTALVDGAVLFTLVAVVWAALRRRASAQVGYVLFLLVIARFAFPLAVPVPAALGWLSPREAVRRLWQRSHMKPYVLRSGRDVELTAKPFTAADLEAHRDLLPRAGEPQPAPQELPRLSTNAWLMLAWSAVVAGLVSEFTRVQWATARRFRGAKPASLSAVGIDMELLGSRLGLHRPVPAQTSDTVGSPVVWGLWRPTLIVPADLADRLPRKQLEWALLHELAHVRRRDLWVALVQRLVQMAYFFHPAVWLANRQIDRQREFACDDAALAAATSSGRECAAALVSIAECACGALPYPALGLFHSRSKTLLRTRVMRLSCQTRGAPRRLSVLSAVLLAIVAVAVLPHLRAQDEPSDGKEPSSKEPVIKANARAEKVESAALPDHNEIAQADKKDDTSSAAIELPPHEQREKALKIIRGAGGSAGPDFDKLLASGVRKDFHNPKYLFVSADLRRATLTDRVIAALAAFPELERLDLAKSAITDDQLVKLPLRNVRHLDLSGSAVTDRGIDHLTRLEKMEELDLSGTSVTDKGLAPLAQLTNLRIVSLDGARVTDAGMAYLAKWPRLEALGLSGTRVGDAGLEHLRNSTGLASLRLNRTRVSDAGLAVLKSLSKLGNLELHETRVSDVGLEAISNLADMQYLDLGGTRITDASATTIALWKNLTMLDLSGTLISDVGVKRLSNLKELIWLDLEVTQITDAALKSLANMDKLDTLNLADTPITNAGLMYLKRLVSLRHLNLSGTQISDTRLEAIKDLPNLLSVDVRRTKVTALDVFRAMPRTSPNVEKILAALGEKTELDFTQQPLSDVVDYLKQRHEIEIQFDNKSLGRARVELNVPITANVKGITLREALEKVLDPLKLSFALRHEVLLITGKPLPETVADFPVLPAGERLSPKVADAFMQRTEIDFADQPFKDVIAFLANKHKIPIEIDVNSLAAAGVGLDVPISRWVKGITLKSALELILPELDLVAVAEGEKVVIRTKPAQ